MILEDEFHIFFGFLFITVMKDSWQAGNVFGAKNDCGSKKLPKSVLAEMCVCVCFGFCHFEIWVKLPDKLQFGVRISSIVVGILTKATQHTNFTTKLNTEMHLGEPPLSKLRN